MSGGGNLLHLLYDGLESLGVVEGEVSEDLAVDLDASLVESTHERAVAQVIEASGSVDTLDPEGAEVALLGTTVAVGIGETLLVGVLGNCPDILTGTEIALCLLQYAGSLSFGSYMIY
jgi:hypothetical protein